MRAKMDEMEPADFIFYSVPILRVAVYHVRPFAKDWLGLHRLWREYESKRQSDAEKTAFHLKVDETERKRDGGKSTREMLSDYLNKFDDYVAS